MTNVDVIRIFLSAPKNILYNVLFCNINNNHIIITVQQSMQSSRGDIDYKVRYCILSNFFVTNCGQKNLSLGRN